MSAQDALYLTDHGRPHRTTGSTIGTGYATGRGRLGTPPETDPYGDPDPWAVDHRPLTLTVAADGAPTAVFYFPPGELEAGAARDRLECWALDYHRDRLRTGPAHPFVAAW